MALRKIRTQEDEILKKISKPVTAFDAKLQILLGDMKDTLTKADGVGLAAVQIGILRRIVVIDVGDEHGYMELINPEITERGGEQRESEGCLSLPNKTGITLRPMWVKFKAQDRNGNWYEAEGEGLFARCVCHELDHLDGVVFTQRLAPGERVKATPHN